ncbi:MAG: long-chain acyl-CoA synthetase [Oceanospirillaceae bacterium]|jgi:long-chain acyl-CoA synthetase
MLSDKILQNTRSNPDKIVISWRGETVTYGQLGILIESFQKKLTKPNKRFFIKSDFPIKAIAQLIACQLTGNSGLIISNDLPETDKSSLSVANGFIDFPTSESVSAPGKEFTDNYFLGVLTSGSSGTPKVIFKDNDCWERAFSYQSQIFGIHAYDNIFVLDALAYSANLNAVIHALWLGASVTFGSLSSAKSWGKQFTEEQITSTFLVPSHLKLLMSQEVGRALKSVVTAGEKLSSVLAQSISKSCPDVTLTEYYGTAELGHISYHQNEEIIKNSLSVGKPFPEVQVDILDKQLYVKSPYVSPEYRNAKTVGDLGIWENDCLILLGRSGRMFNRRGLNIYAQEIEQKALLHPAINEAYLLERLVGTQKKLHLIFSVKSESPPYQNIAKALIIYLQALLPAAKCPNRVIEVKEIPRLSGGKIDENKLLELLYLSELKDEADAIYELECL